MITWVTVWVLTVIVAPTNQSSTTYQLSYGTQAACLKKADEHKKIGQSRCDFQQIPVVVK